MNNRKGLLALSPLFVFVTIYLVASIIAQDFYKVPISVRHSEYLRRSHLL